MQHYNDSFPPPPCLNEIQPIKIQQNKNITVIMQPFHIPLTHTHVMIIYMPTETKVIKGKTACSTVLTQDSLRSTHMSQEWVQKYSWLGRHQIMTTVALTNKASTKTALTRPSARQQRWQPKSKSSFYKTPDHCQNNKLTASYKLYR